MNRTYPRFVDRNIPVPEWAKAPFTAKGMPPTRILTIGTAKSFARTKWQWMYGSRALSEEEIKRFVFSFHWRWRGDEVHRYEILARWAYEFLRQSKKDGEQERRSARA